MIDLKRHGVIEAHAGTGKTWTIVNDLVLPMVLGRDGEPVHIRDICIVTYTDKAAEELRLRIRKGIQETIARLELQEDTPAALLEHCRDCLDNIHESLTGTIHGICLRLLKAYPFETGMQFTAGMADDASGLEACMRESIREDWPRLQIDPAWLGFERGTFTLRGLIEQILQVAGQCCDPDVVLAGYALENGRDIAAIVDDLQRRARLEAALVGMVAKKLPDIERCAENPLGLDDDRKNYLHGIVSLWKTVVNSGMVKNAAAIIGRGRGPDAMSNKLKKNNAEGVRINGAIETACEAFRFVAGSDEFNRWKELDGCAEELSTAVILRAVPEICRRWNMKKRRDGILSFGDMLLQMRDAVCNNGELRRIIRSKIRYAIIDEFQDTSVVQWDMFRRLFIDAAEDGCNPRLFLVGDPKQSIYSFQNAVVESYIDACETVRNHPAAQATVNLMNNFRSTQRLVNAYNMIFTDKSIDGGFFATPSICYASENQVEALPRSGEDPMAEDASLRQLIKSPLQIVPVHGSSRQRQLQFAHCIHTVISATHGKKIMIPDGLAYSAVTLDYQHYAVIAETHAIADMLLQQLLDYGIPACKYKQDGIFASVMAREWRTLLSALIIDEKTFQRRIKALFTSFFDCNPLIEIPEEVFAGGSVHGQLIDYWEELARKQEWPRLFRSIVHDSGVTGRLLQLTDGERRVSDLRQIMDYSMEYCMTGNPVLDDLIQYLAHLELGYEQPQRDASLHARESDRNKVQVMTIHAAKGLEFPVCFAACGASRQLRSTYWRWTEKTPGPDGAYRLHLLPYGSSELAESNELVKKARSVAQLQILQERRRLLYVALTRPQALLFVPMQLESGKNEGETYCQCLLPKHNPDHDLTPVLQKLADEAMRAEAEGDDFPVGVYTPEYESVEYPDGAQWAGCDHPDGSCGVPSEKLDAVEERITHALRAMDIPGRVSHRTSYSALAKITYEPAGGTEEQDMRETEDSNKVSGLAVLTDELILMPPGKQTGNILHELIEAAVSSDEGLDWVGAEGYPQFLFEAAERSMAKHYKAISGVTTDTEAQRVKLMSVVKMALGATYELPGYPDVNFAAIGRGDMFAEAEFLAAITPGHIVGYMDLLFRQQNDDGTYRYFIIDWKSNLLSAYTPAEIDENIIENSYDMQAKIYCHALDTWLKRILGASYVPEKNLGGALYVYLRGLEQALAQQPTWFYKADPEHDARYTGELTEQHFMRKGHAASAD